MDRLTPTRRPADVVVGWQRWRSLLFLHWEVDPAAVAAHLPPGLEVDRYEGRTFVGVVPFGMEEVRPRWVPKALAQDFLETNVRVYVHHRGRPGVYFLSLEAASLSAVLAARVTFGLPYFHARMSLVRTGDEVAYRSVRRAPSRASLDVRYRVGRPLPPSEPGSLAFFLLERYLLFAERGGLRVGQVHHAPYPAHEAEVLALEESLVATAGLPRPPGPPPLVHYATGVDVEVFPLRGA